MNLRRLATFLADMGAPLSGMVRSLVPKPEAPKVKPAARLAPAAVPDFLLKPEIRRAIRRGYSGNSHQRRIARRAACRAV